MTAGSQECLEPAFDRDAVHRRTHCSSGTASVARVLGEVRGRHIAPVALVDLDGDPDVKASVGEAEVLQRVERSRLAFRRGPPRDGQIVLAAT